MRAFTTPRSVSDAGSNTSLRTPPPNSGRNSRSAGLVRSNCSMSSRTRAASSVGAAVRPSLPTRNGNARCLPFESAILGSSDSLSLLLHVDDERGALRRLRRVQAQADAVLEQDRYAVHRRLG